MSTTPVTSYTSLALPGISGYDFSSIIQAMVNNYSLPLNQMNSKKSALETKQNAWRDINTRMSALETTLNKLRDSSTWNAAKATSSKTDLLTATGTSGALAGTYNIKIQQTALAQTVASDVWAVDGPNASLNMGGGTFEIKVGEETKTVSVRSNAGLEDIARAINDAKAGVNASVVKVGDGYRLALTSTETGVEKQASFKDVSSNVLEVLGVLDDLGDAKNVMQEARDAMITINGIEGITSSSNTFTDAIKGVTLELTGDVSDTVVTVKVEADTSKAEEAIQAFVDQYNSVIAFLNDKTKFEYDAGAGKVKAKGDLFGDPMVNAVRERLRGILSSDLGVGSGNAFTILAEVGISTSSMNFGKDGMLEFDKTKFRAAMEKDSQSVINLLGGGTGDMAAKGLGNVMKDYVRDQIMTDGRIASTLKSYTNQLKDVNDRITAFTKRIETYTERTKLQFARLETLLAKLEEQNQSFQMQLSQLTALQGMK